MNKTKKICELLREEIAVPIFEFTLPNAYANPCIVVSEQEYNYLEKEGEYHINIYSPNITRTVEGIEDNSCPDRDAMEDIYQSVKYVLAELWNSELDVNLTKSKLLKEGAMHYLNLSLTINY